MTRFVAAELEGACHCGAVSVALRLSTVPAAVALRACQCGFCRRHGAKTLADPEGMLTITAEPGMLRRYQFGLKTADFLLCEDCGCYIAAISEAGGKERATLNAAGIGLPEFSGREAQAVSYDDEDTEGRLSRRIRNWMPVEILNHRPAMAV